MENASFKFYNQVQTDIVSFNSAEELVAYYLEYLELVFANCKDDFCFDFYLTPLSFYTNTTHSITNGTNSQWLDSLLPVEEFTSVTTSFNDITNELKAIGEISPDHSIFSAQIILDSNTIMKEIVIDVMKTIYGHRINSIEILE